VTADGAAERKGESPAGAASPAAPDAEEPISDLSLAEVLARGLEDLLEREAVRLDVAHPPTRAASRIAARSAAWSS